MADNSSALSLALWRGTIFFVLVILFEIFWSVVIDEAGIGLTTGNVLLAAIASVGYVIAMYFIDRARDNT